jgi:hypothetical protein
MVLVITCRRGTMKLSDDSGFEIFRVFLVIFVLFFVYLFLVRADPDQDLSKEIKITILTVNLGVEGEHPVKFTCFTMFQGRSLSCVKN